MNNSLSICGLSLLLASGIACPAPNCTITSTGISFGNYDPLSSVALASTGTLGFSCTSGVRASTGVNFTISLSTGSSGTYVMRTLESGAIILNYNLYTTVAYTTVWGNGTAGTATVTANYPKNKAPPVNVTIYGLTPAQQNIAAGSYVDSITATVMF